jgi:anti-sigma regulatory factor (Ser/Thr protein kinase)
MDSLHLPFTHDADSASIRRTARHALSGWQTPPDLVADTLVVITELVQNAVRHTGDGGELVVRRRPDAVLVEVQDTSSHLPETYPPDPRRIGGRGLHLVAALAHEWGSRRVTTGKIVWARMPAEQAARTPKETR